MHVPDLTPCAGVAIRERVTEHSIPSSGILEIVAHTSIKSSPSPTVSGAVFRLTVGTINDKVQFVINVCMHIMYITD